MQQQLYQSLVSPVVGSSNQLQGAGLCKMGLADDADVLLETFERVPMEAAWDNGM